MNKQFFFLLVSSIMAMGLAVSSSKHHNRNDYNARLESDLEVEIAGGPKSNSDDIYSGSGWFTEDSNRKNKTAYEYTEWTAWSRCTNCFQRRMKLCISDSCQGSRMYEERPCRKKRCKRKSRHKESFHVVHINENSSYLIKQAPSDIWSKWSAWTPCSRSCRTFRVRRCRKPGRCSKQEQKEEAYCYEEKSSCELLILNLLEHNRSNDASRFHYNNQEPTTERPRRRPNIPKRCGVPNRKTRMLRIIGGTEAKRYKWPWHVAVLNQHMEVFCGGTLISPRWVLTASHCIRKYLRVRLNAHDLQARDGGDVEMVVYKTFPHPKFDYKTVDNDIALLMLPRPVHIPVACLPTKRPKPRQLCSVMGWGKVDPEDVYGIPILHEAKLPIVPSRTCRKSYKQFFISSNMLCAGWASGRADTCAGDSGGGLMCTLKHNRRTVYSIQGITSFGDGCGRKNKYGIYTTVFNYIGWINYIINHFS